MKNRKLLSVIIIFCLMISEFAGFSHTVWANELLPTSESSEADMLTGQEAETPGGNNGKDSQPYVPGEAVICVTTDEHLAAVTADNDPGISPDTLSGISEETIIDVSRAAKAIANGSDNDPDDVTPEGSAYDESTVIKLVHSDSMTTDELIEYYENQPGVVFAERNYIYDISSELTGDDDFIMPEIAEAAEAEKDLDYTGVQYTSRPTASGGINVPDWNNINNVNAEGVVIAVLDSGIDYNHPDLADVMWDEGENYPALKDIGGKYGYNAANDAKDYKDPYDDMGHGTHCAGIVAAKWNDFGVSGVANGARLMAVKALDSKGRSDSSSIIKCMNYIKKAKVEAGVNVAAVNCSFGGPFGSFAKAYTAKELTESGIVLCYASGNETLNIDLASSSAGSFHDIPGAIIVNSSTEQGEASEFSNYSIRNTDVFAPGSSIMSTMPLSKAAIIKDLRLLSSKKDINGTGAGDNFTDTETYFKYEANEEGSVSIIKGNDAIHINGITLPSDSASRDSVTVKTVENTPAAKDAAFIKTLVTITPKGSFTPQAADQTTSFVLSAKWDNLIKDQSLYLKVFAKTVDGTWKRPAQTYPLAENYSIALYKLEPKEFDVVNPQFRLMLDSVKEISTEPFDVSINVIRITDSKPAAYAFLDGTSMACPAATGAVAIAAAKYKDDTAPKRAARILASTSPIANYKDLCATGGIVDVANLLDENTYTPVIDLFDLKPDGLHIGGYFFGKKEDLELTLKQGDKIWTNTADFMINNMTLAEDGHCELTLSLPEGIDKGEVIVTATNKGAAADRQSFTGYFTIYDPNELLSKHFITLDSEYSDTIKNFSLVCGTALNGKLYLSGYTENDDEAVLLCYIPGTPGAFKSLKNFIYTRCLTTWNSKLISPCYGSTYISIYDPVNETSIIATPDTGDEPFDSQDQLMLYNDDYNDGREILMLRNKYLSYDESRDMKLYDNTQVWSLDPMLMKAVYKGTLNRPYDLGMCPAVVTHKVENGTETVYIMGKNTNSSDNETALVAEAFTPRNVFTNKDLDISPVGTTISYKENEKYTGAGLADGIFLTGCCTTDNNKPGIANILNDNYYISYAGIESGNKFMPSSKRISSIRMLNTVTIAYNGYIYCFYSNYDDPYKIKASCTKADTLPAYGDRVIYPDDPSGKIDKSVKVTRLTLNTSSLSLKPGDNTRLTATPVWPDKQITPPVIFESSNPFVAHVLPDTGELTAADPGTAVITAYCGNKKATCKVTVTKEAEPKAYPDPKDTQFMKVGEMKTLYIQNAYATGNESVSWKSKNTKVASVNKGVVTAKGPGSTTIVATHRSGSKKTDFEFTISVTDITVPRKASDDKAVKLSVSKNPIKFPESEDVITINAMLTGEGYASRTISVNSTNTSIFTVKLSDSGKPVPGNKKNQGNVGLVLTSGNPGTAYAVVESYDPAVPEKVNRVLIKVSVSASAEKLRLTQRTSSRGYYESDDKMLHLRKGLILIVDYTCNNEDVCTDIAKAKWSAKGGAVKVKNGVITATSVSKKDKNGNYIPSVVTLKVGDKSTDLKIIVEQ